jgi:hypothetical protein
MNENISFVIAVIIFLVLYHKRCRKYPPLGRL